LLKYLNNKVPTQNLSEVIMDVDEPVAVEIESQQEMETKESKEEEEKKEETKEDKDL